MSTAEAWAKINLALVVGPLRPDRKHEVATVLQRVDLCDTVTLDLEPGEGIVVEGFEDTIVRDALAAYAESAAAPRGWKVRIEKRIPVSAGLGGGSSDAGAALRLANALAAPPLSWDELHAVAARVGSDVPFFLEQGPQLATADGSELTPLALPLDYWVTLVLPEERKESTASVYDRFDVRDGAGGFEARRVALVAALDQVESAADLAALPRNDLASSPVAIELERHGAFRADVSGAGPAVYGLFELRADAEQAALAMRARAKTWVVRPVP